MGRKSHHRKAREQPDKSSQAKGKQSRTYRSEIACDSCIKNYYCIDRSRGIQCNCYEGE